MKRSRPSVLRGALWVGAGLGLTATVLMRRQWRRWQQTPPVSANSHHAGLAGYFQQIGDWRIFTRVTPHEADGLPVVLVHGLVLSGRAMEELALALSTRHQVWVPDLPGFGASALPANTPVLSVDQLAEALWQWWQHNALPPVVWVASAFGCQVVAALAEHHPEAVAGLVLQGPTVDRHARSFLRQGWRTWRNARLESSRSVGELARIDYAKAGVWRAWRTLRAMLHDRIERRLTYITAPTLLLRGSRDRVSPARWLEELEALLPNGEIVTLRGGTHMLHYAWPWSFCRAIRPFLIRLQQENHHE